MSSNAALIVLAPAVLCALTLAAPATAQAPAAARGTDRVVVIEMQGAVAGCNEGQRDFDALAKKYEPRRLELQKLDTELEGLKKQLAAAGPAMTPAGRDALTK